MATGLVVTSRQKGESQAVGRGGGLRELRDRALGALRRGMIGAPTPDPWCVSCRRTCRAGPGAALAYITAAAGYSMTPRWMHIPRSKVPICNRCKQGSSVAYGDDVLLLPETEEATHPAESRGLVCAACAPSGGSVCGATPRGSRCAGGRRLVPRDVMEFSLGPCGAGTMGAPPATEV